MNTDTTRYYVKELFPSYVAEVHDWRENTVFWRDFSIADRFGLSAVKDTWGRAFKSWQGYIKYLTELCIVMNHKCCAHYGAAERLKAMSETIGKFKGTRAESIYNSLMDMSRYYGDCYHKACNQVFGDESAFSEEDRHMFFKAID